MAKKVTSFILLICCFSMLSGCEKVKDLTDEETRLIAEYAATSLLKYDLTYTDRIAEGDREALEKSESKESVTEATTTEEATTEELATEETTTEKESSEGKPVDNAIDEETDTEDVSALTTQDIAGIVGEEGLSITYSDYLIAKQYPAKNKEGELIYLDASEGYELLVVRFKVKNLLDKQVEASFLDKEVDYKLLCNGNKAAIPMLTILLDDLTTLEVSLNPLDETEAVLVFQIAESMKDNIQTIELKVHYNDADSKINILR